MDLRLSREEVGRTLGVKAHTLTLWELGLRHVSVKFLPAVIRFLGYDPVPEVTSLPDRLKAARRRLGLSQRELARRFGMDRKTIQNWERRRIRRKTKRVEKVMKEFLQKVEATSKQAPREGLVYRDLRQEEP